MNQKHTLKQLEAAYNRHIATVDERKDGINTLVKWLDHKANYGVIETFATPKVQDPNRKGFKPLNERAAVQVLERSGYDLYITVTKLPTCVPSKAFMDGVRKRLDLKGLPTHVLDRDDDSYIPYIEHAVEGGFIGV